MVQVRELEQQMFLNNEIQCENMFWKSTEKSVDESKREFLKKAGIAGAGAFLAAKGLGIGQEAKAAVYDFSKLPPGIAQCRDQLVPKIYGDIENYWRMPTIYTKTERLARRIGIGGEQIKRSTPFIEPAVYFVVEKLPGEGKFNFFDGREWEQVLKPANPALFYFAEGIHHYFGGWVRRKSSNGEIIERNFVYSIFNAAYPSPTQADQLADKFLSANLTSKAIMADEVIKQFNSMKGVDKTSEDPNNPYNRMLVAAWSSFWLSIHLELGMKEKEYGLVIINKQIEIPLRKFVPKVRGPPHYL